MWVKGGTLAVASYDAHRAAACRRPVETSIRRLDQGNHRVGSVTPRERVQDGHGATGGHLEYQAIASANRRGRPIEVPVRGLQQAGSGSGTAVAVWKRVEDRQILLLRVGGAG